MLVDAITQLGLAHLQSQLWCCTLVQPDMAHTLSGLLHSQQVLQSGPVQPSPSPGPHKCHECCIPAWPSPPIALILHYPEGAAT